MMINITYYGMLAEITTCNKEQLQIAENNVSDVLNVLFRKYPKLKVKDFQVAVDNELVSKDSLLTSNEIALLPPFSGG